MVNYNHYREDIAAYRNTTYDMMMNEFCKQQHTPIIEARNNVPPPSRPGPPSPNAGHSANVPPNFSLSRTVGLDLTEYKEKSEKMHIDLSRRNAEDKSIYDSEDAVHSENPQFLQVEKKLFGEDIASTSFATDQVVTKNKLKPIIHAKKPYNKKRNTTKKIQPIAKKSKPAVESANKKFTGPLIRLNGGNIEDPNNFVIINKNIPDNDSLEGRNINPKTYTSGVCNVSKKSDVSNFERSDNCCIFCLRGRYVRDIGYGSPRDLFGPYYINIPKVVETDDTPKQKTSKCKLNDNDTSERLIEVWAHEKCLVWTSGIFMVGATIFGLEDTVQIAKKTVCVYCGVNGASIGCTAHLCKSYTHYSCAIDADWLLDDENFITSCNIHRNSQLGK